MALTYGYVYVAQVAMGADKGQTLKAMAEAEAYHGPSLIIAYSPCEMHSMKGGMQGCQRRWTGRSSAAIGTCFDIIRRSQEENFSSIAGSPRRIMSNSSWVRHGLLL